LSWMEGGRGRDESVVVIWGSGAKLAEVWGDKLHPAVFFRCRGKFTVSDTLSYLISYLRATLSTVFLIE